MGGTLAVTGKGGTGKTVISALTIQWLVQQGHTPVLAVDADSNANLHEVMGVTYSASVGSIRESALEQAQRAAGVSKQELLDLRTQQALVERRGYDLLVMGRPEGRGCYCFANTVLRDVIQRITRSYEHLVVDSEAGLEHISRRTLLSIDHLCVVSDATVRGVRTAQRIAELADELETPITQRGLIINRAPEGPLPEEVARAAGASGLALWSVIPRDPTVESMDAGGLTVDDIPQDAPARLAVRAMLEDLLDTGSTRS
jgi:CO dehydrogenase maturation factor